MNKCSKCGKEIKYANWKDEDYLLCDECVNGRINPEIRYYLGRHKIGIMSKCIKKALIIHLEDGYVGNKTLGYKFVNPGDHDVTPIRNLWRGKK